MTSMVVNSHFLFRRHKLWWCPIIMKNRKLRWCVCYSKRLSARLNHNETFKCFSSKFKQPLAILKNNLATNKETINKWLVLLTRLRLMYKSLRLKKSKKRKTASWDLTHGDIVRNRNPRHVTKTLKKKNLAPDLIHNQNRRPRWARGAQGRVLVSNSPL